MLNENNAELEDKLAKAKEYLRQMKNEKYSFDKGKIIFKRVSMLGIGEHDSLLIIGVVITWILMAVFKSIIVFIVGVILFLIWSFFTRKEKTDRYLVIDYENKVIYNDIRKNNKSISKEIIIEGNNLISIGINNRIVEASSRGFSDNLITNEVHESAVAFLKNNGELFYFIGFVSNKLQWVDANNRLMARVISELFDKPLITCSYDMELNVVKAGTTFKLSQKPLKRLSVAQSIIKQVFTTVISFILGLLGVAVIAIIIEQFK